LNREQSQSSKRQGCVASVTREGCYTLSSVEGPQRDMNDADASDNGDSRMYAIDTFGPFRFASRNNR
jgi:hypothetical protein